MRGSALILLLMLILAGCSRQDESRGYVARVGNRYLTEAEVQAYLQAQPFIADTQQVRNRFIDAWVTRALLAEQAREKGLDRLPEIRLRIQESTDRILMQTYLDSLSLEASPEDIEAELHAYYERNREALALREPYVRLRYLVTLHPDSARVARRMLQEATRTGQVDSLWPSMVYRFSADTTLSFLLSSLYVPVSQLPADRQPLWDRIPRMKGGEISPVVPLNERYHFFQLVALLPKGTVPELEWIAPELRQEVLAQLRKQMVQRHVQRLRQEALAGNQLEIKNVP